MIFLTAQELDDISRILVERMRSISCSNLTRQIPTERIHQIHTKLHQKVEDEKAADKRERDAIARARMAAED